MTKPNITLIERAGQHCVVFTDPALVAAKRIPARGVTIETLKISSTSRGILVNLAKAEAKRRKCPFIDATA